MRVLKVADELLRGTHTRREPLSRGEMDVDAITLLTAVTVLGVAYGAFMGLYAVMRGGPGSVLQLVTSMAKVPLLFVLTLVVTFPSLYVFSALAQSRLTFQVTLRLLLAAMTVNMALLASFGPVTGFFTLSTDSYPFMVILNVVFFTVAGVVGLSFLRKAMAMVFEPLAPDAPEGTRPGAARPRKDVAVFRTWTIIYAVVGAQMGWILRPFVGDPNAPFQLFRARQGNFFLAVGEAFLNLFR